MAIAVVGEAALAESVEGNLTSGPVEERQHSHDLDVDVFRETADAGTLPSTVEWPVLVTKLPGILFEITTTKFTPEPTVEEGEVLQAQIEYLTNAFSLSPPFTLQRLAELIAYPNSHYKPSARQKYLRALERIVGVESTYEDVAQIQTVPAPGSTASLPLQGGIENPTNTIDVLLSPIQWLVDTGTPPPDCEPLDSVETTNTEETENNSNAKQIDTDITAAVEMAKSSESNITTSPKEQPEEVDRTNGEDTDTLMENDREEV
ncbi:uncharacterized protein V1516DRAFT_668413 [Lipomyces oligophaga]|uniref:uncharacterized protein n=1 Tax=Lipomyces oligophaga TaxID=45792 RepID=UPI0034CFBD5D